MIDEQFLMKQMLRDLANAAVEYRSYHPDTPPIGDVALANFITAVDSYRRLSSFLEEVISEYRRSDDNIIPDSGVAIAPKRLGQIVSVRLDADFALELSDLAEIRGISRSDIMREGAAIVLAQSKEATAGPFPEAREGLV